MKFILDSVENQQYDIKKGKKMQTFVLKHKKIKNIIRTHTNFKLIKISNHSKTYFQPQSQKSSPTPVKSDSVRSGKLSNLGPLVRSPRVIFEN